jgi:hypothetical protein
MALLDFETALGRLVRSPEAEPDLRGLDCAEIAAFERLRRSAGFRFTAGVQRSWCIGRAARAAAFTLSVLPEGFGRELLEEWVDAGGGTSSFFGAEAEGLLEFIAGRLPDPSHELSACRFEQATLRANAEAIRFTAPALDFFSHSKATLRRGRFSGMAVFYGEPEAIIEALAGSRARPPVSHDKATAVLFAPGLDRLCRLAAEREAELWQKLRSPVSIENLLHEDYRREVIVPLVQQGVLEPVIQ